MYSRSDPRFRRTLNQISQNLESANESAQVGLFSFTEHYLKPCFASIKEAAEPCYASCLPSRDDRLRRRRALSRTRPERSFDFYDDWEATENDALLSLGNEEFDRLLGHEEGEAAAVQPARQRVIGYGSRADPNRTRPARRSTLKAYEERTDPTIIPNQSYFGFMNKLPFTIGRKGLRYKPSVANLQDRPQSKGHGAGTNSDEESQQIGEQRQGRRRSDSGHTTDSLSSRGDIFPSDDEADAVPLDDEFIVLEQQRSAGGDGSSSGRSRGSKRQSASRLSTRTHSSKGTSKSESRKRASKSSSSTESQKLTSPASEMNEVPIVQTLQKDESKLEADALDTSSESDAVDRHQDREENDREQNEELRNQDNSTSRIAQVTVLGDSESYRSPRRPHLSGIASGITSPGLSSPAVEFPAFIDRPYDNERHENT